MNKILPSFKMAEKKLSIIVPMYDEAENVEPYYSKTKKVLSRLNLDYEIIFIDDGSTDNTLQKLKGLKKKDNHIRIIVLRKNFGKSAALSSAFEVAQGKIVITMDGDLQDEPEEIPKLLNKLKEGYDLVSGWKKKRQDPITKTIPSKFFNWLTSKTTKIKIHDFNCGFKAYKNEVVKELNLYGEMHRYIPALAHWQGFKVGEVAVVHKPRKKGKSKYGAGRLLKGFFDLLTVKYLSSFSSRPLHLFGTLGLIFSLVGIVSGFYLFVQWLMGIGIGKRPLLMFAVLMVMIGIQFISIGLLGEMIANNEQRKQKSYNIKEIIE